MAKKVELKERVTGEVMYPVTTTSSVIHSDERSLSTIIDNLRVEISNIEDAINNMSVTSTDITFVMNNDLEYNFRIINDITMKLPNDGYLEYNGYIGINLYGEWDIDEMSNEAEN